MNNCKICNELTVFKLCSEECRVKQRRITANKYRLDNKEKVKAYHREYTVNRYANDEEFRNKRKDCNYDS